ncbi:hypothetical protein FQN54_000041 [Arachnomyces sp. PD_36]|nr:hypothetical protein FQN54_000041 [Arachnomyces sp. PD_36]
MLLRVAFLASLLAAPLPVVATCAHGTSLHPRSVEAPTFGYGTIDGPINWHGLTPENKLCAIGENQSPIDIHDSVTIAPVGTVAMEIPVQDVHFENLGTTVEAFADNGTTVINGEPYDWSQMHFHTPSEHRLMNEHFPVEAHLVHESQNQPGRLAVIAVFLQLNETAPIDGSHNVLAEVSRIPNLGDSIEIPDMDLSALANLVSSSEFYTYSGSLTTPPCAEGVDWYISGTTIPLHLQLYNDLKAVVGTNNRHIQSPGCGENIIKVAARNLVPK